MQGLDAGGLEPTVRSVRALRPAWGPVAASPATLPYDGFQSPAAGPASGRVSPESHDAIVTIKAWS